MDAQSPKLTVEKWYRSGEPFGNVTGPDGDLCPVFIRVAAADRGVILIDLADDFRANLAKMPQSVAVCAEEISAMVRDAILREGCAGVVS